MTQTTPEEILNTPTETVTLVGFVLDKSGSMGSHREDAIEGTNEYITGLQQKGSTEDDPSKIFFTLTLFDDSYKFIYDSVNVKEVPILTQEDYVPGGMTALNDAIGATIVHMRQAGKKLEREGYQVKYIVTINTDGHENSSTEYKDIKSVIEQAKEEGNWSFLFLGADIDAFNMARQYNINRDAVVSYGKKSTKGVFRASGMAVNAFAASTETRTKSLAADNATLYKSVGGQTSMDDAGVENDDGTRTVGKYKQKGMKYTKGGPVV